MNRIRISTLVKFLALALLAACLNAGPASAEVFRGKFTLPFEAHWGQATLPAGDYSFVLDSTNATSTLRVFRGNRTVAMIMAWGQDEKSSGRASLTVVGRTVRTLSLPEIGLVLHYVSPQRKHLTAPEEREMAQVLIRIPSHT